MSANENHQLGIVARTLDERLDATGPFCSVRPLAGQWAIYLDDEPIEGTFATSRKALAGARHYKAELHQKIAGEFFKTTGLSESLWTLNSHAVVNKVDPAEFIVFYRRAFMAHIGCHALPPQKTVQDAVKLINTTFHLPGPMLLALEQVYSSRQNPLGPGSVNWELFKVLREKGFLTYDPNETDRLVELTPSGRAALSRDPRGLPLELREIIFEGAQPEEREHIAAWNSLISSGIAGQINAQGLKNAIANRCELRIEEGSEEGRDIIIRGRGMTTDGLQISDVLVASFPTQWEPFKAASKGLAHAIIRQQAILASTIVPSLEPPSPANQF